MNEEPKFTKGSWNVELSYPPDVVDSAGLLVSRISSRTYKTESLETEANAYLIAAAPEIYKLLVRAACLVACLGYRQEAKSIEDFLKKARGEQ